MVIIHPMSFTITHTQVIPYHSGSSKVQQEEEMGTLHLLIGGTRQQASAALLAKV